MKIYEYQKYHPFWHRIKCWFSWHNWNKGARLAYLEPHGRIWWCSRCGALADGQLDKPIAWVCKKEK